MWDNQESQILSSLHFALQSRNILVAKQILKNSNNMLEYRNSLGETLIHLAVKNNFKKLIEWLIENGLDINSTDSSGRTALHLAVALKNKEMTKYLLNRAASTTLKDKYSKSPFHMIVHQGNPELIEVFLQNGANVLEATVTTHQSALHIALENEDKEIFKYLLKYHSGEINVSNVYGESLLHLSARKKFGDLARLLLDKGANLDLKNNDLETSLHFAIHSRDFNISSLFIDFGADVNAINKYGEAPLHLAVRYKDARLVNLLLSNAADIDVLTNDCDSVLHIAIHYFVPEVLTSLLRYDVETEIRNSCDLTPFHLAIKQKCLKGAEILLNNNVDVNAVAFGKFVTSYRKGSHENQYFTPLHTAIVQKDIEAVTFLLESGAKMNLLSNYEIFLAVEIGSANIIELLIKNGANVNAINDTGQSLLFTALKNRKKEEVETLLKLGANRNNINEIGVENKSALHLAVKAKDVKFVQFLIDIEINVNICDANDDVALSFAHENTKIANSIIAKIALLKVKNFFVCQKNESLIKSSPDFDLFFSKCLEELKKMQNDRFCNVSLILFLTKDVRNLATFVRRKNIVNELNSRIKEKDYPIYHRQLLRNAEKAIERCNLIIRVENLLDALGYFNSLYDVLNLIVSNFTNEELKNFISQSKTSCNISEYVFEKIVRF